MARRLKDVDLKEGQIHRLVFETFGLRRYTQDSPIQPDAWIWFLELAARRRLDARVPLIITPKETPGKKGEPPGGAAQLAEEIRRRILQDKGLLESESRGQERANPNDATAVALDDARKAALRDFKIASTARNVVINANFEEVLRYLVPITAWWTYSVGKDLKDPKKLSKILRELASTGRNIRTALVTLRDTEFLRFAALTAVTCMIGSAKDTGKIARMVEDLSPPRPVDDLAALLKGRTDEPTVERIADLWKHYHVVARKTFAKPWKSTKTTTSSAKQASDAASFDTEVLIWSIQRNRMAQREAIDAPNVLAGCEPLYSAARLSRQAVKADAAIMLFSISTKDLTWAVVDTGIDAQHEAFSNLTREEGDGQFPRTRVLATLDFTRLRDLLAEDVDLKELLKVVPKDPRVPDDEAMRLRKLQSTLDSIRRRNVNGRELDWTLLEPLIRLVTLDDKSVPKDPHGTHVAGILGGRLPKGVVEDDEPFIGICPEIRFYDLRVFAEDAAGEQKGGDEFTILAALDYITWANKDPARPRIHGVNLSLSIQHVVDAHACGRTPVCDACNRLVGNGTVVVAAAGNAGFDQSQGKATLGSGYRGTSITDPGNAELVITVGATHRIDPHAYGVSYFSSRGPTGDGRAKPDLVAPGEKIRSSAPGNSMLVKDGTSMAAPHVSGVCALLMARHREFIGEPKRIKEILMKTATDLGRERSFQGAGLVDALRALQSV